VLLVILLIIIALLFWGGGTSANNRSNLFIPRGWLAALLYTTFLAQFLWPILAGSWSGNEYGWGTIRLVLSRRPNRVQYVLAAMLTLLVAVVIALLATVLLACLAGAIVAAATGNSIVSGSVFTSHFSPCSSSSSWPHCWSTPSTCCWPMPPAPFSVQARSASASALA
jgi:ABC-type transport system involved in multi-copper enzyme maturation permease subunit